MLIWLLLLRMLQSKGGQRNLGWARGASKMMTGVDDPKKHKLRKNAEVGRVVMDDRR